MLQPIHQPMVTIPDNNPQTSIAIGDGSKVNSTLVSTITGLEGNSGKVSTALGYITQPRQPIFQLH